MSVTAMLVAPLRRLAGRSGPSPSHGTAAPPSAPSCAAPSSSAEPGAPTAGGGMTATAPVVPGTTPLPGPDAPPPAAHRRADAGMTTAEYAIGTVAACGFAAVLFRIVRSQAVLNVLTDVITRALHTI